MCNEFVRGDKKRFGSKSQIKMSSKTESSKLNLKFKSEFEKKREEKKKVPTCVISKSFLCRGKHTQILESVTTCQNLSKT